MKVYNTNLLNNKQRFPIAIAAGIISAFACALAFALFEHFIGWHFSLFYVAMAYGISSAIKYFGRGVQLKFSIVGVICFILSVVLGFIIYYSFSGGFSFQYLPFYLSMMMRTLTTINFSGIFEMICIAYSIYLAFYNSRIL